MVTKSPEELEALSPEQMKAYLADEEMTVFGRNKLNEPAFERVKGVPQENGIGSPGRESGNHLASIRKYEGEEAYGTATSSNQSIASIAYQVACDPKVQLAIAEMSQQYVTTLGPVAVRALKKVLDTPSHRDFGRAIGLVIERVSAD